MSVNEPAFGVFVPVIHKNCGKIAFYISGNIDPDEPIYPEKMKWPNGEMCKEDDPLECGSCGEPFFNWYFNMPNIIISGESGSDILTMEIPRTEG
jgi:hypothetical protein